MSSEVNYISYFGPDITAAYSGRSYPNKRHKDFLKEIDVLPSKTASVHQVHGDGVIVLKAELNKVSSSLSATKRRRDPSSGGNVFVGDPLDSRLRGNDNDTLKADALITNLEGVALTIKTADCIPLFLFDPVARVIGLVHAGWKGLEEKIVSKTIEAMENEFHVDAGNIKVVFGPAIHDCCYEVGSDFLKKFNKDYYTKRSGKNYLDLIHVAGEQLLERHVNLQGMQDLEVCPSCRNEDFFSYRKEKTDQRILSVIMLGA